MARAEMTAVSKSEVFIASFWFMCWERNGGSSWVLPVTAAGEPLRAFILLLTHHIHSTLPVVLLLFGDGCYGGKVPFA